MRRRSTVASVEKAARALELDREALCSAGAPRDHPYLQPPPSRDGHLEEPLFVQDCLSVGVSPGRLLERVRSRFILTMAANNLARLPRLLAA